MTDPSGAAIRPAAPDDLEQIVQLNNQAVPAVSVADVERMGELIALAAAAWVVDNGDGGLAGFVLLFEPGSAYDSANYRWFAERFDAFLYVDRVVVAAGQRGGGLGATLYEAVAAEAGRRGSGRVLAEVNLEPPNPGSSRFHRRHGFEAVGELRFSDDYVVEMLERPVP